MVWTSLRIGGNIDLYGHYADGVYFCMQGDTWISNELHQDCNMGIQERWVASIAMWTEKSIEAVQNTTSNFENLKILPKAYKYDDRQVGLQIAFGNETGNVFTCMSKKSISCSKLNSFQSVLLFALWCFLLNAAIIILLY